MLYNSHVLAETAALKRMSRDLIGSVRQNRNSLQTVFEATQKAIARSHELIRQTDRTIETWIALGSGEPKQEGSPASVGGLAAETDRSRG
jgi:hypothetical protein